MIIIKPNLLKIFFVIKDYSMIIRNIYIFFIEFSNKMYIWNYPFTRT